MDVASCRQILGLGEQVRTLMEHSVMCPSEVSLIAGSMQVWTSRNHDSTGGCICRETDEHINVKQKCPVAGHWGSVTSVAFAPDGKLIVSETSS